MKICPRNVCWETRVSARIYPCVINRFLFLWQVKQLMIIIYLRGVSSLENGKERALPRGTAVIYISLDYLVALVGTFEIDLIYFLCVPCFLFINWSCFNGLWWEFVTVKITSPNSDLYRKKRPKLPRGWVSWYHVMNNGGLVVIVAWAWRDMSVT